MCRILSWNQNKETGDPTMVKSKSKKALWNSQNKPTFIVKVQLALFTSALQENTVPRDQRILVYNEDRSIQYEGSCPGDILKLMGSLNKRYFYAYKKGQTLDIGAIAPDQEW